MEHHRLWSHQERSPEWKQQWQVQARAAAASSKNLTKFGGSVRKILVQQAALALLYNCMDILLRKQFLPQMTHTNIGESTASGFLALLLLPSSTSLHPALVLKVKGCSAKSPPSWMRRETDLQPREQKCLLS